MRIEAYSQIQQIYQPKKTQKVASAAKIPSFSDNLQISSIGKDIQTAKQAVAQAPDIREEITAPLKASIAAGTYNVSSESFADKLLEKYQSQLI